MANNEMTNGLKAREIANCNKCPYNIHRCKHNKDTWCHEYRMTLEMAQWKDEQFAKQKQAIIDNACEWLKENFNVILERFECGAIERVLFTPEIEERFRKAMEETK